MPFFSVIIPTFNRPELLAQTLESVRRQHFTDYEVIVVDDGSTDGTLDYLQSLKTEMTVLHQPNRGPGAARNFAAKYTKGHYLAFLDSDDLWFPWTLEVYRTIIRNKNSPCFVAGKPYRFWNENELNKVAHGAIASQCFPDYFASGDAWRWWGVSSFVICRDTFVSVGGFTDESMNGEDADLALKIGVAAGFVQVTSPMTFAYREHADSATKDFDRTVAGAWHKVRAEKTHCYPGGTVRARERWRIMTRHIRPVTFGCLQNGARAEAWALYCATFGWNVALRRWKYLAGFPIKALLGI